MVAFAEVTSTSHGHGGSGWELGHCLWHQAKTRTGQDRNANMRRLKEGDEVFHLVSGLDSSAPRRRFLWGVSRVISPCRTVDAPPNPGEWSGRSEYYRIDLAKTLIATNPVPLVDIVEAQRELIMDEIGPNRMKYYLFSPHGETFRVTQGIYVTNLSEGLAGAFRGALAV